MFNILFISPSFYPATYYGGPIYSNYELAKTLIKNGFDVKVITTDANGKERLKIETGVFHRLDGDLLVKYYHSTDSKGTSFSMLFNFWRDIKEANLVHLISIFSPPTPAALIICRFLKKPVIIWPHGQLGKWSLNQGSKFKKLWLRLIIRPFIQSIYWNVTSEKEEKDVLEYFPTAKSFVTPNIIDLSIFSESTMEKNKSYFNKYTRYECKEHKIIVSMGRLHKVKGFDILIEAVEKVQSSMSKVQGQDVILFIAGEDFGERKNLEELIDKLGLKDKIFLIGKIEGSDKIEFLRNADVFALASHHENFGIVYAEALASGLPVVASRNTPWQDVEKYNCGKCVDNSSGDFANAITKILDGDLAQMSENGRKYISESFSSNAIIKKYNQMFETILNKR